jgi:hypothetical protein
MTNQIHNLYITSATKSGNDTNYNFNLYLPSYNIKINEDEDAYLNITSFQTLNSFYNINDNSKFFTFKVLDDYDLTTTYNFTLETGNYDIYEFQDMVNGLCSQYFTMTYNKNKNVWSYKASVLNTEVFIKPNKYNYKYFGLTPDIFSVFQYGAGTYSGLINMNSFSLIVIKVIGLVELNKAIDNFNKEINRGDTACIISRQDTSVGAEINWISINNLFIKKISNLEISQLTFSFYNEFNEIIKDLGDWVMTLSIEIKKKQL